MPVIDLGGQFEGWQVFEEEGIVCCDVGFGYRIGEIGAIFYWRDIWNNKTGSQINILGLKEELEKRVSSTPPPQVLIDWG